ncbi:hypothetical protein BJY14_002678 [Actinomadura luteofluorescens]|uniref:Uncharacterized protein n=1 Tax=Actinomadura luteofluorescens TaxID=46163 RepID=A0A7Y9EF93_9ACTN|nr:hypothetical protein [Actinomadura luteofluorescens]NYD46695.1 hypothetical protein [Actinomadura luteofluorescens]
MPPVSGASAPARSAAVCVRGPPGRTWYEAGCAAPEPAGCACAAARIFVMTPSTYFQAVGLKSQAPGHWSHFSGLGPQLPVKWSTAIGCHLWYLFHILRTSSLARRSCTLGGARHALA